MGIKYTSLHLVPICKSSSVSEEFSLSLLVWCDICARKITTNAQKEYLYPLLNYQRWSPSIALNAVINNKQMTNIDDATRFPDALKKKKTCFPDKDHMQCIHVSSKMKIKKQNKGEKLLIFIVPSIQEHTKWNKIPKKKSKIISGSFLPRILFKKR